MSEIILKKRYPHSRSEDITDAFMRGYVKGKADRQQEWIPCSERLPEEEGEYLVTAKKYAFDSSYYDVQIAYCSPNKKWFRISNCEIVAWMPRPKPWEGADDGTR